MAEDTDRRIVQEMWTLARNEPLTLAALQPFGFVDKERYRRHVGGIILEFTLDSDPRTHIWGYELSISDADGGILDSEVVDYWLTTFFGSLKFLAARRNFLFTGEARFTFPYTHNGLNS